MDRNAILQIKHKRIDGITYKNINRTNKVKKLKKKQRRLQRQVSRKYLKNKKGDIKKMKYNELNTTPLFCLVREEHGFDQYYGTSYFFEKIADTDDIICYKTYIEDWCDGYEEYDERSITSVTTDEIYEVIKDISFTTIHYESQFKEKKKEMFDKLKKNDVDLNFEVKPIPAKDVFDLLYNEYFEIIEWVATETSNSGKTVYKSNPENAHRLVQVNKFPEHRAMSSCLFAGKNKEASQNDIDRAKDFLNQLERNLQDLYWFVDKFEEYFACYVFGDYSSFLNALSINLKIKKKVEEISDILTKCANRAKYQKFKVGKRK